MGMIECKKHGLSGFSSKISKNISDKILNDIDILDNELIIITLDIYDNNEYLYTEKYLIESKESKNNNIQCEMVVRNEDESDNFSKLLPELGGICFKCMNEYKEKHKVNLLNFK